MKYCDESGRGCRDLWASYVRGKVRLSEPLFKSEGVKIEYEQFGLVMFLLYKENKTIQRTQGSMQTGIL